jgi:hypothetical protein
MCASAILKYKVSEAPGTRCSNVPILTGVRNNLILIFITLSFFPSLQIPCCPTICSLDRTVCPLDLYFDVLRTRKYMCRHKWYKFYPIQIVLISDTEHPISNVIARNRMWLFSIDIGGQLESPQVLRPLLRPLCTYLVMALQKSPESTTRSRTNLVEALLISIGSSHVELEIPNLCPANSGHWQSIWYENSSSLVGFEVLTAVSTKMAVNFYQTTWRYNPEDSHLLNSSSCPHLLHLALSERPIICRCHLNVQWPVKNHVTSLHCFLSKSNRFLDSL